MSTRLLLWQQLAESCGASTLQQGLQQVWKLLLLCLLCRLCFRLGETHTGAAGLLPLCTGVIFVIPAWCVRACVHGEACDVAAGWDVRPLPVL